MKDEDASGPRLACESKLVEVGADLLSSSRNEVSVDVRDGSDSSFARIVAEKLELVLRLRSTGLRNDFDDFEDVGLEERRGQRWLEKGATSSAMVTHSSSNHQILSSGDPSSNSDVVLST